MLSRIIILNSTNYGKAIVRLDDCDSIQLVGPNSIGKSTLIFALNFLFIIDGKKMIFIDNKQGDKETNHHYFPSPVNSYVIFEIFKQRYYCIILKRNNDGEIEYYRIDHEYRDELFLTTEDNKQTVLKFDELRTHLANSGVELHTFKDKREVFNYVYQRGRKNDGVVWLDDSVISDGLSNNFSKIYRYLINSKLITNKTLKEALIVADNRDKEGVNFSQKSKKDINDLLRVNDEIKSIVTIKDDFFDFREIVNQYRAKSQNISELVYAFNQLYEPTRIDLENKFQKKLSELKEIQIELNEQLYPRQRKLYTDIGGIETELGHVIEKRNGLTEQVKEINSFEGVKFLNEQFANLDKRRKNIESNITRAERLNAKQIEQKISDLKMFISKTDKQIKGYSNQLIHKITDNQKNKEILNFILSTDFSSQSADLIQKEITKIGSLMELFDGKIKLPKGLKGSPIPSIDELTEKLTTSKKEQEDFEKLLPVAIDFEKTQKELQKINEDLEEIKSKLAKIKTKPALEKELETVTEIFKKLDIRKRSLDKELSALDGTVLRKSSSIPNIVEDRDNFEKRIQELITWKDETEKIKVEPIKYETTETLDLIYKKIELFSADVIQLKGTKDRTFDNLKYKVKSNESDESVFIKFVEDEIATLSDKQKSVETILKAISTQFANPAYTLLKRYDEFKEFINNKFNTKLSRIKISNIESLKLELSESTKVMDNLRKISSIQEFSTQTSFDFNESENLKVLNDYLDSGRKIEFDELFDIELHLSKDGKEKTVDLKEQVESTGTDIMIRLVIIMSVINRLAISDKGNKITIAIDEIARIDGKNRLELFRFCKEHNFIPVCTSTEETILDGFDKYILLYRPPKGKKVNISEMNIITQERVEANE